METYKTYKVILTFTEPLLGAVSLDPAIYEAWIGKNAPDAASLSEEIKTLGTDAVVEKGTTGFHRVDGAPILYDYVLRGFCKDACSMLRRVPGTLSHGIKAYRKIIDGLVFVAPRKILIDLGETEITFLERPLRAQTAQGERIALARSEMIAAGASITFTLSVLGVIKEPQLREWFDYGMLRGLGQWRNASYGRFTYEMIKQ